MKAPSHLILAGFALSLVALIGSARAQTFQLKAVEHLGSEFKLRLALKGVEVAPAVESRDEPIPNPHRHPRGEDILSDVVTDIKFVEADPPPAAKRENIVLNKPGTFSAFTTSTEDGIERIFFTDLVGPIHKTYEIQGVGWPNRPLNDPACVGHFFIFDRSVNPHRSIHYAFDLSKRIIKAAQAF